MNFILISEKDEYDLSFYLSTITAHIKSLLNIHSDIASNITKDHSNEDHETRAGLEPASSDNRSAILPLNCLFSSLVIKVIAYPNTVLRVVSNDATEKILLSICITLKR